MRMHPIQKVMKLHAGQDYPTNIGTRVNYDGVMQSCGSAGNAGIMAVVGNACGITQRYMHLSSCSNGNIVTGNTGGSTGPHLHYEVRINGTAVDPMKAFGKDLCKEDVRKELLEDAKNKGSGGGGAGAAANTNSPPPTPGPVGSATYVPTGGRNPGSGTINTGAGYYYVEGADGRTYTEIEIKADENMTPILGPTTENVVQTGSGNNPVTGCATDTWTAMVNQAVLQTRREVVMNGRFIAKSDTVMAYSCLEDSLKKMGENLGPVFSESKRWVNKQIDIMGKTVTVNKELGESSLDGAIYNAANTVFISHARTAFNHDILGGMMGTGGAQEDEEGTGQDGLPCGTMKLVWDIAKCLGSGNDQPPFPKFEELISNDPRKYPRNFSCKNTGITQNMIDIARGKDVEKSKYDTHLTLLYPKNGQCAPPVATGVTVERPTGSGRIARKLEYPDGVCLTAGCTYQNSGSGSGKCVANGQ